MKVSTQTAGVLLLLFGALKFASTAVWAVRGGALWITIAFVIISLITVVQGLAIMNYMANDVIETYIFAAIGVFLVAFYAPQLMGTTNNWDRAIVVGNIAAGAAFLAWAVGAVGTH